MEGSESKVPIPSTSILCDFKPLSVTLLQDLYKQVKQIRSDVIINVKSEQNSKQKETTSWFWRYRGYFYALLSSLIYSLTGQIIKYAIDYHPVTLSMWSFLGSFILAFFYMTAFYTIKACQKAHFYMDNKDLVKYSKKNVNGEMSENCDKSSLQLERNECIKVGTFLVLRSILTCSALILNFNSKQNFQSGNATVIFSFAPMFAYFFAHYFLKEPIGFGPILSCASSFLGILAMVQPTLIFCNKGTNSHTLIEMSLTFASILLTTLSFVTLRYIRKVHCTLIAFSFGTCGLIETLCLSSAFGVLYLPNSKEEWTLAGLLAILTLIGQYAIINALRAEAPGPVTVIRSCDIIFGIVWKFVIWGIMPNVLCIVGAFIVVFGVITNAFLKWLSYLPTDGSIRRRLWFLLH